MRRRMARCTEGRLIRRMPEHPEEEFELDWGDWEPCLALFLITVVFISASYIVLKLVG